MAEKSAADAVENGAKMDYAEHERTYSLFLAIAKYSSLVIIALLVAMAFGFFTTAGFFSSTVLFILITALGAWLLR